MNESTVYIVDDDPAILKSVQNNFRSNGMMVRAYHSAEEFIKDCRSDHPACLILDLQMPGMNGMKLIEWMRARHIEMPVVVLSGHGDIPAVVESMKLGVAEFIEKPADDRMLVKRVCELLESASAKNEERAKK